MRFVRGDTKAYKFQRRLKKDHSVIMTKADSVTLTVRHNPEGEVVLQKTLNDGITFDEATGYYYILFEPADTKDLEFETYGFDIQVISNSIVHTIETGRLTLDEEYTY